MTWHFPLAFFPLRVLSLNFCEFFNKFIKLATWPHHNRVMNLLDARNFGRQVIKQQKAFQYLILRKVNDGHMYMFVHEQILILDPTHTLCRWFWSLMIFFRTSSPSSSSRLMIYSMNSKWPPAMMTEWRML